LGLVRVRPTQAREIILKRGGVLDLARGRATGGVTGTGAGFTTSAGAVAGSMTGAVPDMEKRRRCDRQRDRCVRLGEPRTHTQTGTGDAGVDPGVPGYL